VLLPRSMIGFDDSRKMGEHALSGVTSNFKNTIKGMKRLVGLPFADPRAQKEMLHLPGVTFVEIPHASGGATVGVSVKGLDQPLPVEAVAGMMVHHMGTIAASKAAEQSDTSVEKVFPQDWVVAIPNYYDDAQRRALQAGCEMVGLGIQRFVHENTATALSYGMFKDLKKEFTKDKPTNVMFIDMGASAYTVSIASFEPGQFKVKAAYCDPDLGGRDFDAVIANYLADKFEEKFKGKLSAKPMEKPKVRIKLFTTAEKAKKTLSPAGVKEARVNLEMLMDDFDFNASIKADEYEAMCAPLLARLAGPVQKALAEAKVTAADMSAIEIVGGSTRIGCVKRKLLEILGVKTLSTTMNADEAVARGAALQSAILSPRFKVLPYEIQECQPYPIQIEWPPAASEETSSVVMFDRGLSFPVVRRVTLKRAGPFEVKAVYTPNAMSDYGLDATKEIATFQIKHTSKEETKVRVNIKADISGVIQMSSAQMVEEVEGEDGDAEMKDAEENKDAKEGDAEPADKKKKIKKTNLDYTVSRPLDWTTAEINKYHEIEVAMANNDRIVRETADMRNELESYIYGMRDKVTSDSQLGTYSSDAEKAAFTAKNEATENWLYEDGFDASKKVYAEKLGELKALGEPMEKRQRESQQRPAAVQSLQASLETFTNWVNESQSDAKYDHITDGERETVRTKSSEISTWLYEQLDKQGNLGLDQDPAVTVSDIQGKHKALTDACSKIMYKARPPPPKKEEAPKEEKPAEEAKKEETGEDATPMEGVEVGTDGTAEMDVEK